MNWTEQQLADYRNRRRKVTLPSDASSYLPDEGPEYALQAKIEKWCMNGGFFFFHDRSRQRNVPGMPDLVIALNAGRVLWLELKSAKGRMSEDQKRVRLMLMHHGHEFHEVRSYRQFLDIVGRNL